VPEKPTVLVADSVDERRRSLGLALYEGGYEVINAVSGEEALRFTAGLDPTLVIAHEGLDGVSPLELRTRLHSTGLEVPPFLVLCLSLPESTDDLREDNVYFLESGDLEPALFLHQVRLLLLARDVGGELSDTIDVLYGDLTRVSLGDLLEVLLEYQLTGHVSLTAGPEAGIWLRDGEVIDAHWSRVSGAKAFSRICALRGGSFIVTVEPVTIEGAIEQDLAIMMRGAVEERLRLDEMYRLLPALSSRLELQMDDDFFAVEFTTAEQEVLTHVQSAGTLAALLDAVPLADLEVLNAAVHLREQGFLVLQEPERRVHVVTDSTCDLLPSLTRRRNITVVPLSVLVGSRVYKDGIDLQPDQFYELLRSSEDFPSTSPPGKGEFLEAYRQLIGSGDVVSVHVSQNQSLTGANAQLAVDEGAEEFLRLREEAGGGGQPTIRVVDSLSNSVGLGLLVIFASRLAQRGCSVDEIVERLEDYRQRCHFLFVVDTLEFLKKGGRVGGARAWLGTLLGIKPILGMVDGEVVPVDKIRGGRSVHPKLVELFRQRVDPERPLFAALAHASAPKWGTRLRELLETTFSIVEVIESEIGPVVGAHAGPGTVGAILFQPTDEELELLRAPEEEG